MLNISTVFDGAYDHKVCPEQSFLNEHFCSLFGTLAWAAHGLLEPLAAGPSFRSLNWNFRWRLVAEKCQMLTSCTFLTTEISMKMETGMMMILTISFHRKLSGIYVGVAKISWEHFCVIQFRHLKYIFGQLITILWGFWWGWWTIILGKFFGLAGGTATFQWEHRMALDSRLCLAGP